MNSEFPLQLETPLWLTLIAAPWLFAMVIRYFKHPNSSFADINLLPFLIKNRRNTLSNFDKRFIAAWIVACIALSQPIWLTDLAKGDLRRGLDIAVVIDISPSMAVQDMAPSRLARIKMELRDLLSRLDNDRLALVAFSANAYTLLPLTFDKTAFLHFSDLLSPQLTTRHGSNVARALTLAERALNNSDPQSRVVILFSDGEIHDKSAIKTATLLKDKRIPLLVFGIGTAAGGPVPDENGKFLSYNGTSIISRANMPLLRNLAGAAGGTYIPLTYDDNDWHAAFAHFNQLSRQSAYTSSSHFSIDLFPWLLIGSFVLFFWFGMRRPQSLIMVAIAIISLAPNPSFAAPWDEQQARNALIQGDYSKAESIYRELQTFEGFMGLGAIAYKKQQWQVALEYYRQALPLATTSEYVAQAQYNIGNALARSNQYEAAASAYRSALRFHSNYSRAALNLSLVTKAIALQQSTTGKKQSPLPSTGADEEHKTQNSSQVNKDTNNRSINNSQATSQKNKNQNATMLSLDRLEDNTDSLLQRRLAKEDGNYVIVQDKPW